jgi:hypothetical protein
MYGNDRIEGLSTNINVGVTEHSEMSATCFYDKADVYRPQSITQGRLTMI